MTPEQINAYRDANKERIEYSKQLRAEPNESARAHLARRIAHHAANVTLGHTALRQGPDFECSKCCLTGNVTGPILTGNVFYFPCGVTPFFGNEKTLAEINFRIAWEDTSARALVYVTTIGVEHIIEGHAKAVRAYRALRRKLPKHGAEVTP